MLAGCYLFAPIIVGAQSPDSVDVTFFYTPAGSPTIVYLPGEFNNWGENQNGRIFDAKFAMTKDPGSGVWSKTVRLRLGGPDPLPDPGKSIPGAYQYKFNENGSSTGWLLDPLNPNRNQLDFNNSYILINDPTIHYLLPNSVSGEVKSQLPEITAYIFPALTSPVDPSSIRVEIDQTKYSGLGSGYDPVTHHFRFVPPTPLAVGTHSLKLSVSNNNGNVSADSTTFKIDEPPGFIEFLTRPNDRHLRATKTVVGETASPNSEVTLTLNSGPPAVVNSDSAGRFSLLLNLQDGDNLIRAEATDTLGVVQRDSIKIRYFVDHAPKPQVRFNIAGTGRLQLTFDGNDPDGDALAVTWRSDDEINPEPLAINSQENTPVISVPSTPGEYYFDLIAVDPDSNIGVSRSYFVIKPDGGLAFSSVDKNPQWVKDAIVYEIYMPAFTDAGTFAAAKARLPDIKDLGANVVWLMPIYDNAESINELNAGYNITDFFSIHPQLGTQEDFRTFVDEAHSLGIRVILDSTPSHVSGGHDWVTDVRKFQDFSNYRPFLETQIKGDSRGLGQSATRVNDYTVYVHYSNWTLANLDYDNIETVDYMLNMYKYWVLQQGIDGYRMDVYWGPQNRYGKSAWWRPFREEIKRVRPDVLILGETGGTGFGSEINYSDFGGANDAAYDWSLFGEFKSALNGGSISTLHSRVRNSSPNLNYNHFTGSNSHYLRFLENHDETRIAQEFNSDFRRTKAGAALLFTIPGIPLIYAGQEVGETSRRGKIDWQRNGGEVTFKYYQRLGAIRNQFAAFRSREIKRLDSGAGSVYAYLRPWLDANGVAAINLSGSPALATLAIDEADLQLSDSLRTGIAYFMNDVLNDTSYFVGKPTIGSFQVNLAPWQAGVFVLADTAIKLVTSVSGPIAATVPDDFELFQNYPNPFNPGTKIRFSLAAPAKVHLEIFNILGEKIRDLLDQPHAAGEFTLFWDGKNGHGIDVPSGLYVLRSTFAERGDNPGRRVVKSMKLMKLK